MGRRVACCVVFATAGLVASTAGAQSAVPSQPRVSLGVGAGVAAPFHGDFDFTPWAWEGDARVAMSRRVLLELAVGEWRHSTTTVDSLPGSSSTGLVARVERETTRVQRMAQVNVLARGNVGRVRLTAGGGVGLLQHKRRTRGLASGCTPEMLCGAFESSSSSAAGSVQAAGGVDLPLTRALALYGQARFVVPMTDPAGTDLRLTAGVRWRFGT